MNKHGILVPVTVALFVEAHDLHERARSKLRSIQSALRKETEFEFLEFGYVDEGLRKFQSSGVLVDTDGLFIKRMSHKVLGKIKEGQDTQSVLNAVAKVVGDNIRYNLKSHLKTIDRDAVGLPARYFRLHGGVCRHQSAIAAGVLQRIRDGEVISGKIRIVHGFKEDLQSGHAWVEVYSAGKRFVVDPTKGKAVSDLPSIGDDYDKEYPIRRLDLA